VVAYVGIGFPLGSIANLVLRSRAHWTELEQWPHPKLLIAGTRDSYCPLSTLRSLVAQFNEEQEARGATSATGLLELQTIDGADHFFPGAVRGAARGVGVRALLASWRVPAAGARAWQPWRG
jgi:pimeloyl-ACP methyl ester carboxylesterase